MDFPFGPTSIDWRTKMLSRELWLRNVDLPRLAQLTSQELLAQFKRFMLFFMYQYSTAFEMRFSFVHSKA
jgi:hypothetical protein